MCTYGDYLFLLSIHGPYLPQRRYQPSCANQLSTVFLRIARKSLACSAHEGQRRGVQASKSCPHLGGCAPRGTLALGLRLAWPTIEWSRPEVFYVAGQEKLLPYAERTFILLRRLGARGMRRDASR